MLSEETSKIIERQTKRIMEIIRACPLFLRSEFDNCRDNCPAYRICWSLQDREENSGKDLSKTLEVEDGLEVTDNSTS